jgi:hypothetical protein
MTATGAVIGAEIGLGGSMGFAGSGVSTALGGSMGADSGVGTALGSMGLGGGVWGLGGSGSGLDGTTPAAASFSAFFRLRVARLFALPAARFCIALDFCSDVNTRFFRSFFVSDFVSTIWKIDCSSWSLLVLFEVAIVECSYY